MTDRPLGILTDTTLCIGCEECVAACKERQGSGPDRPWRWQEDPSGLSGTRLTAIVRGPGGRFVRRHCRHCLEPACVSVCPVGALRKDPAGPVHYHQERCLGCRYCVLSCPFGIPRYAWERTNPVLRKCDMCHDLVAAGGRPACVAACPTGATLFGPREELLALARRRLAESPGRYRPRIYGETEAGGTSVLYISDLDLSFLGNRPDLGTQPLPALTRAALAGVPWTALGVGGLLTGLWWIIGRRRKLAGGGDGDAGHE